MAIGRLLIRRIWPGAALGAALASCSAPPPENVPPPQPEPERAEPVTVFPQRQAFFGDLHVHTSLSIDAFITQTRTLPDDAYLYAKGEPIEHVSGKRIRIRTPLDFMAVTDHSELLGVGRAMADPRDPLSRSPLAADITSSDYAASQRAFRTLVGAHGGPGVETAIPPEEAARATRDAWQQVIDAAERNYEPGRFTTFVAYEWTSMPGGANLHRNVVFAGEAPDAPFTSVDSARPEDLWARLDMWRESGVDAIAIPHNGNASTGLMYPLVDSDGRPVDADYAARRMRNEPVSELTQFKGTSETHPVLSPADELADFEIWNTLVGSPTRIEPEIGSYVRTAYLRGLALFEQGRSNPYAFALIGSSDSHDASSAVEEFNFTGGHGNADATPETRLRGAASTLVASSLAFSAAGLAGVWAESNTRESIFAALRRGETFATSGPRIRIRLFASAAAPDAAPAAGAPPRAELEGVPMGGRLALAAGQRPRLSVWALRDPRSAPLERLQIIKGSLKNGKPREEIYDVACSDGLRPDPARRRCPDNGAQVDAATCDISGDVGAVQLAATWEDPDYTPGAPAFYYARVIENPTCRWSSWDALRLGVPPPASVPPTLKERAWSSPVWVEQGPKAARSEAQPSEDRTGLPIRAAASGSPAARGPRRSGAPARRGSRRRR